MTKLVSSILVVILLMFSVSALAETNFSTMTDEEIEQIIQEAQNELNSRKAKVNAAALESDGMVTVQEAGFQVKNGKYLYYSFIAHSNLNDKVINLPEFRIVIRDTEGDLIGSHSQIMMVLYPGQDIMYGGMAMDLEGEKPASIEVEFVEPGNDWHLVDPIKTKYPGFQPIEVESARLKSGGNIVGEFTNPNSFDIDQVAITVVFRDTNGKLLAGNSSFARGVKAGKTMAYEIHVDKELTTDNYEVFVQPW